MFKPSNYDQADAKQFAGFNSPVAGATVLGITSAQEIQSRSGSPMLVLSIDIAEGEYKRYYTKLSADLKKDCMLKHRRTLTDDQSEYLKGDIKAIEESNKGFKFNFDERSLVNKLVGGMLREKEYLSKDGSIKTFLEIAYLCSVDKVRSGLLKPMPIKKLDAAPTTNIDSEPLPF